MARILSSQDLLDSPGPLSNRSCYGRCKRMFKGLCHDHIICKQVVVQQSFSHRQLFDVFVMLRHRVSGEDSAGILFFHGLNGF